MVTQLLENLLKQLKEHGECVAFRAKSAYAIPADDAKELYMKFSMDNGDTYEISRTSKVDGMDTMNYFWECEIKCNDEVVFQYKVDHELIPSQPRPKNQVIKNVEAFLEAFTQPLEEEQATN